MKDYNGRLTSSNNSQNGRIRSWQRMPRDRARQWARDAFLDVRAGRSWSFREKPSATQRTLVRGLEAELRELRNERAQLKSELAKWRAKLEAAKIRPLTEGWTDWPADTGEAAS